ncbi:MULTISPECIES: N-acetylglucosamine kinase [unclassified Pseudoclavibacter]|uniref:N-acetylglucosamine kinase n=1 Tax=unclassified Pseudoclavibacter TaxID=2615177 RepID=UPI000CE8ABFD|nr:MULTISPECIES: BadF/BadG/BcrA/BcrD ATPase family protein [unclassified Pseudoclavibacter]MBS3179057.1 hypothetical protein [Pseudoclavibacter sp. Marseille-Q4354]NYF11862.1 N-acetylglucosamine kinase-like BadF-type ATPase [Pseudoclavibacter sp. JAI123]PPG32187.1 hypothetical protein C5B97_03795 [Pseudoclavibacter sp. RFBB5]
MTTTFSPAPVLAIDAGQSGIRSQIDAGEVRSFAAIRTDLPLAPQLASVVEQSLRESGLTGVTVSGGVSGVTHAQTVADELALLVEPFGVARVFIAHDSISAFLGALGSELGAVVAAGTGVVTLAVGEERLAQVDGWGYLVGDAGSGYWIGRAALDAVMRAFDGRGPETALTEVVLAHHPDLPSMYVSLQTNEGKVRHIASFARSVGDLAETDAVAAEILAAAGSQLAASVAAGLARVGLPGSRDEVQVRAIGNVFSSPHVAAAFRSSLLERVPQARVAVGESHPLDGAAMLPHLEQDHALIASIGVVTL